MAAVSFDDLDRRQAFQRDLLEALRQRLHLLDVSAWFSVLPATSRSSPLWAHPCRPVGALGQHHPHPPGRLQIIGAEVGTATAGGVELYAAERGQRAHTVQLMGTVAQHPPKCHDVLAGVVDGFGMAGRFVQQHLQAPGLQLHVVGVLGQHRGDAGGGLLSARCPLGQWGDHCGVCSHWATALSAVDAQFSADPGRGWRRSSVLCRTGISRARPRRMLPSLRLPVGVLSPRSHPPGLGLS